MINDGPFRKGGNFLEKKENRKLGEIKAVEWNHGSNLDHDLKKNSSDVKRNLFMEKFVFYTLLLIRCVKKKDHSV